MATERLPNSVDVMVRNSELLTCLSDYGCDERIVCLYDSRKEMVGGLMVESSGEDIPEPTVCGVVLRSGYLHLRPVGGAVLFTHTHITDVPILMDHLVFWIRFRPLHLYHTHTHTLDTGEYDLCI